MFQSPAVIVGKQSTPIAVQLGNTRQFQCFFGFSRHGSHKAGRSKQHAPPGLTPEEHGDMVGAKERKLETYRNILLQAFASHIKPPSLTITYHSTLKNRLAI